MKHSNLLSGGLSLLIALILLGCGILIPSALLEFQERQILQRKRMYPIEAQELEGSDKTLSSSKEYQELLYRLLVWEFTIIYHQEGAALLEAPEEYELSRENAVEKSKQELLRLMELGVCPNIDFDEFSLSETRLMGANWPLDDLKDYGLVDFDQIDLSRRVSRWVIVWKHKKIADDRLTIEIDAQTGKIYTCEYTKSSWLDFEYGDFLLMFGKYHDLLEFRSEWEPGYGADSRLSFDRIQVLGYATNFEDPYYKSQDKSTFYLTLQTRWYW